MSQGIRVALELYINGKLERIQDPDELDLTRHGRLPHESIRRSFKRYDVWLWHTKPRSSLHGTERTPDLLSTSKIRPGNNYHHEPILPMLRVKQRM